MKKSAAILMALVFAAGLGFATDFGAVLTEKTTSGDNGPWGDAPPQGTQQVKLSPWGQIDINENARINFKGYDQFYYDSFAKPDNKKAQNQYDIEDLNLVLEYPGALGNNTLFQIKLGRQFFYDYSTKVLAHELDGFAAVINAQSIHAKLGLGSTALLFKQPSTIQISQRDREDFIDDGLFFAPRRLVGQLEIGLPSVLLRQNLTFSVLSQWDLRTDPAKAGDKVALTSKGVAVNTYYFGLGFDGKIATGLYYKVSGYLEYGTTLSPKDRSTSGDAIYADDTILAGMGDVSLSWFVPEFLGSRFRLGGNISSGDDGVTNGVASVQADYSGSRNTFFSGISKRGGGFVYIPQFGNSFVTNLGWSVKPTQVKPGNQEFGISVDAYGFMRLLNGAIDSPKALVDGSNESWLGAEIDLSTDFKPVSDVQFTVDTGVFLPNTKAIDEKTSWKLGLSASLAL